jgi:hypothetical protein
LETAQQSNWRLTSFCETLQAKAINKMSRKHAQSTCSRLQILKFPTGLQLGDDPFGPLTPAGPSFSWFGRVSILGKNFRVRPPLRAECYVFSQRLATEQSKTPFKLSFFLNYFSPERLDDLAPKKPKLFDGHVIEA